MDQEDFGHLQACLSGAGIAQLDPDCQDTLLDDDDEDVDQNDFDIFEACMNGANIAADPHCADGGCSRSAGPKMKFSRFRGGVINS